jgi:hypothetical protein
MIVRLPLRLSRVYTYQPPEWGVVLSYQYDVKARKKVSRRGVRG